MRQWQCKRCGQIVTVLGPGHKATCSCGAAVVSEKGMYVPERQTFYPMRLIESALKGKQNGGSEGE